MTLAQTCVPPTDPSTTVPTRLVTACRTTTWCDGCGGTLGAGIPVRETPGGGESGVMHPGCYWNLKWPTQTEFRANTVSTADVDKSPVNDQYEPGDPRGAQWRRAVGDDR